MVFLSDSLGSLNPGVSISVVWTPLMLPVKLSMLCVTERGPILSFATAFSSRIILLIRVLSSFDFPCPTWPVTIILMDLPRLTISWRHSWASSAVNPVWWNNYTTMEMCQHQLDFNKPSLCHLPFFPPHNRLFPTMPTTYWTCAWGKHFCTCMFLVIYFCIQP